MRWKAGANQTAAIFGNAEYGLAFPIGRHPDHRAADGVANGEECIALDPAELSHELEEGRFIRKRPPRKIGPALARRLGFVANAIERANVAVEIQRLQSHPSPRQDRGLRREPRGRLDGIVVDPAGKGVLVDHHGSCLSPGRGGSESDPSTATAIGCLVIASKAKTEELSGSHGKPVLLLGEGL